MQDEYCPICGAVTVSRERRPNGNDRCAAGHTFPSREARSSRPTPQELSVYRDRVVECYLRNSAGKLPDAATLVKSLRSDLCPCGQCKRRRQSFCKRCFDKLGRGNKQRLYRRMGDGYEEAMSDALNTLDIIAPAWPQEAPR